MYNSINSDLIRGNIDTIILKSLASGDRYGYDICREIEKRSLGQYQLKQPTLYSSLRRLEAQGFVSFYWGENTNGGRRKYYTLTELGRNLFIKNQTEWELSRTIIDKLISDKKFDLDALVPLNPDFVREQDDDQANSDSEALSPAEINEVAATVDDSSVDDSSSDSQSTLSEQEASQQYQDEQQHQDAQQYQDEQQHQEPLQQSQEIASDLPPSYADYVKTARPASNELNAIALKFKRLSDELERQAREDEENRESPQPSQNSSAQQASLGTSAKEGTRTEPVVTQFYSANQPVKQAPYPEERKFVPTYISLRPEQHIADKLDGVEYKSVLDRLFRDRYTPPRVREEIRQEAVQEDDEVESEVVSKVERAETQKSNYDFAEQFKPNIEFEIHNKEKDEPHREVSSVPNFEFYDEDVKYRDFRGGKKTSSGSAFIDVDPNEYSGFQKHREFVVRQHTPKIGSDFNAQYYIFGNKLRFHNFAILSVLMVLEVSAMLLAFSMQGMNTASNKWIYICAYIAPFALLSLGFLGYRIDPAKRSRATYNFANNFFFFGSVFLMLSMLVVLINILAYMTRYNYYNYLVTIIVPCVLFTNFIIYAIINYFMIRSKRYAV